MAESFYLTLISDTTGYEDQRPSNFRTNLPRTLHLDPAETEVGVTEITYPSTYLNIKDCRVTVDYPTILHVVSTDAFLPKTRLESGEELAELVNDTINRLLPTGHKKNIKVSYADGRIRIKLEQGYALRFNGALATLMGYGHYKTVTVAHGNDLGSGDARNNSGEVVFKEGLTPFVADVNRNLLNMFVYGDFVQHQIIGHAEVPLLRVIPTKHSNQSSVTQSFHPIQYISLSRGDISSVQVQIADGAGEEFDFHSGKVIIKLHFRRKT